MIIPLDTMFFLGRKEPLLFFLSSFLEQKFALPQGMNHNQFKPAKSRGQTWPTAYSCKSTTLDGSHVLAQLNSCNRDYWTLNA